MKMNKFQQFLPDHIHEILLAIGSLASEMGYSAYLAGGIVRDMLLGRRRLDIDVAIEGDAIKLGRELATRTGAVLKGATRFGTCKIYSKAFGVIDLSSTRKETYRGPGALPDVEPAGICEDLRRRDYTINAMAVCLNPGRYGQLIDPFGGRRDLKKGLLRVLHQRSFIDDPTRILRGIRIAARYSFRFEPRTRNYLKQALEGGCLSTISGPRIFNELRLICSEESPRAAMILLKRFGIIELLFGSQVRIQAQDLRRIEASLAAFRKWTHPGEISPWIVWFACFFKGLSGRKFLDTVKYFNMPREVRNACEAVSKISLHCKDLIKRKGDPYLVTTMLEDIPIEAIVHLYASQPASRSLIKRFLVEWRHVKPSLRGKEIAELGARAGPEIGRIAREIRKLKIQGRISSRHEEMEIAKKMVDARNRL